MKVTVTPPLPSYKDMPLFPLGKEGTKYRKITDKSDNLGVRVGTIAGQELFVVGREVMCALSQ